MDEPRWFRTGKEDLLELGGKQAKDGAFDGMEHWRSELDSWLIEAGMAPRRRSGDVSTKINFRRLMEMLKIAEDEDCEFLEEVVSTGVSLGVDEEMPRTPVVYEEKVRWTVDGTDEELLDIEAMNYASAEENHEDITRQVLQEVERGTILRMTASEAKKEFGGRL